MSETCDLPPCLPYSDRVPVLLAVDPGTDKVGFAVVRYDLKVVEQGVLYVSEFHRVLRRIIPDAKPEVLVLGSGTAAHLVIEILKDLGFGGEPGGAGGCGGASPPIRMADEFRTSEEARRRYFAENPTTGIWRFVPLGLQIPPRPVDDYAAVIIGERYVRKNGLYVAR